MHGGVHGLGRGTVALEKPVQFESGGSPTIHDQVPHLHPSDWHSGKRARRGQMGPLHAPEQCPAEVAALQRACVSEEPADRPTASEVLEVLTKLPPNRRPPGVPRMPSGDAMVAIEAAQHAAEHAAAATTAGTAGTAGTAQAPAVAASPQRQRSGLPLRTPQQPQRPAAPGSGGGGSSSAEAVSSSLVGPDTPQEHSNANHAAPSSAAAPSAARAGSLQSPFAAFAAPSPTAPSEAGDEAGGTSPSNSPAAPLRQASQPGAKPSPQGVCSPSASRHGSLSRRSSRRSGSRSGSRALPSEPVLMSISVGHPGASLNSPFAADAWRVGSLGSPSATAGPAPAQGSAAPAGASSNPPATAGSPADA